MKVATQAGIRFGVNRQQRTDTHFRPGVLWLGAAMLAALGGCTSSETLTEVTHATISPEGTQSLRAADGSATLTFPPGAVRVPTEVRITINRTEHGVAQLGWIYEFTPPMQFDVPVTLEIVAQDVDKIGDDEVLIANFDTTTEPNEDSEWDAATGKVTAPIAHFSRWGVFHRPNPCRHLSCGDACGAAGRRICNQNHQCVSRRHPISCLSPDGGTDGGPNGCLCGIDGFCDTACPFDPDCSVLVDASVAIDSGSGGFRPPDASVTSCACGIDGFCDPQCAFDLDCNPDGSIFQPDAGPGGSPDAGCFCGVDFVCDPLCGCDPDCGSDGSVFPPVDSGLPPDGGSCFCGVDFFCDPLCACDPDCTDASIFEPDSGLFPVPDAGSCGCDQNPFFCDPGCSCDPRCVASDASFIPDATFGGAG